MQKMLYAEAFYAQAPSLALYPAMTDAEVDTVIGTLKSLRKKFDNGYH